MYIRYCVVGKDKVFSYVPVEVSDSGEIILQDAMYDLVDTPYWEEVIRIAIPSIRVAYESVDFGEYWNPVTGLYLHIEPGAEWNIKLCEGK